jgi:signal transduction histidine kinase
MQTVGQEGSKLDLWLAMLAGDRVWADGDSEPSTRQQAVSAFMLVTLFITLLVQWVALTGRVDVFAEDGLTTGDRRLLLLTGASLLAAGVIAIRPIRLLLDRQSDPPSFLASLLWRGLAYLVLIASTAAIIGRARFLAAIPLGLLGGSDALLTLWAIGMSPRPWAWMKSFLFSTVHFGVLGALLAAMFVGPGESALVPMFEIYIAMWLGIVIAGLTVLGADKLSALVDAQQAAKEAEVRERERLMRAHWLHDDVLSEVHLSTLRLKSAADVDAARAELEDLDHRLRLRQLDEVIRGGEPHLYEILQPHLRRAQSLGLQVYRVPPLEVTERRVDQDAARLVHRVVSVLTSNAINAGATRLGLDLLPLDRDRIVITVTDDAGGFDLDAVPAGRGLSNLRVDLGRSAVRRRDVTGGSAVSVTVPLQPGLATGLRLDPRPEPTEEPV